MPFDDDCTCPDCVEDNRNYCECGCGAFLLDENCYNEGPSQERREDDLVEALAQLTQRERDAISTAIKQRMPMCVGTWAVDGTKQSYTCLMGTACAVMYDESVREFIQRYRSASEPSGFLLQERLSYAGRTIVPSAFDGLFGGDSAAAPDHTVPSAGGETMILNERGRNLLESLLSRANAKPYKNA